MIAASARTSGTSRPNSSTVKRGVCSSRSSRARAAARARVSCARRARAVLAEYAFFLAAALVALAGVFDAVFEGVFGFDAGAGATVWADENGGVKTNPMAASARDTAIFVRRFRVVIEKLDRIVTRLSPISNRVYGS